MKVSTFGAKKIKIDYVCEIESVFDAFFILIKNYILECI